MKAFLDTSVVLRILFGQPGSWSGWGGWEAAWASDLLGLEARRAIDRLRLDSALDDEGVARAQEALGRIESALGRVRLGRTVLARAALPMATAVGTLDAIHLASALLLQERQRTPITFVTHDRRQALGARALGLALAGA